MKLFQHEGKVLRFKAKFNRPRPEDADRLFVISFYLQAWYISCMMYVYNVPILYNMYTLLYLIYTSMCSMYLRSI